MKKNSQPTILITGCSRGLGRAMVDGFIATGATVIGCARSPEPIAELVESHKGVGSFHVLDICDLPALETFANTVLEQFGAPDLLINNAALINRSAPLWEVPVGEFSDVIDVNIKGTANVIRQFLPAMIDRGEGVIVNFSSGWGRSTAPEVAPYCATKYAIEGLTAALAQELPSGLAAVALNPGIIDTEMLQLCFGAASSSYPSPEEWAINAVPFIAGLGPANNGAALTCP